MYLPNFVAIICVRNVVKIINTEKLAKSTILLNNILDKKFNYCIILNNREVLTEKKL